MKEIKDRIIRDRRKITRKRNLKKNEHNEKLIKDRLIRDIRTLFEQEEDHYRPERVNNF